MLHILLQLFGDVSYLSSTSIGENLGTTTRLFCSQHSRIIQESCYFKRSILILNICPRALYSNSTLKFYCNLWSYGGKVSQCWFRSILFRQHLRQRVQEEAALLPRHLPLGRFVNLRRNKVNDREPQKGSFGRLRDLMEVPLANIPRAKLHQLNPIYLFCMTNF